MLELEPHYLMMALEIDIVKKHAEVIVIGMHSNKMIAQELAEKACRSRGVDIDTVGIFNMMESTEQVNKAWQQWLTKHGIPDYIRDHMIKGIAGSVLRILPRYKPKDA